MKVKRKKKIKRITVIILCFVMLLSMIASVSMAFATSFDPVISSSSSMIVQRLANTDEEEYVPIDTTHQLMGVGLFLIGASGVVAYNFYKDKKNHKLRQDD